jgi:hypothetical protein
VARARLNDSFSFKEEPIGPRYISVHSKQDSLNFVAPQALYDYQNNLIKASEVKLIRVADAIIYTSDGKVVVAEAAQMRSLYDTRIIAGYENRYHTFHSANINISSRQRFTGTGKYDYVDETEKLQVLNMKEIKVDTTGNTIALASIVEPDSFTINPHFSFQGKFMLNAARPLPTFDGGARIRTDCERLAPSWLRFASEIDPKNVRIPVEENPVNINNTKIYNGLFIANDSIHVYPAFTSGRRNYNDKFIISSGGYLRFNKDSLVFEIASNDKLENRNLPGNYLNFHKFNCNEYGEGEINLGVDLGQMKLKAYGQAKMNVVTRETKLNVLLGIDFSFEPSILTNIAHKIDSFPDLKGFDITNPLYVKVLNEILGKTNSEKYREDITLLGDAKEFPAALNHTLFLTALSLEWNPKSRSYQSSGKIGIGNIGTTQINKMVDGFIEITKRRSGDFMDIYLKLDNKNYYYFGYTRGVMQAYSNNSDFVLRLRDVPLKQRQMDVPKGETTYIYMVSSDSRMATFFRSYNNYLRNQGNVEIPEMPEIEPPKQERPNQPDQKIEEKAEQVIDQDVPVVDQEEEKPVEEIKKEPKEQPKEEDEEEVIEIQ